MVCAFKKDGAMSCGFDADIIDEPFMGIVHNTINELADIWFDFVLDSKENMEKAKEFEMIVKI